jgi:hypothetical protein
MCEVCLLFNVQALVELRILGLQVALSGRFATQDFFCGRGKSNVPPFVCVKEASRQMSKVLGNL